MKNGKQGGPARGRAMPRGPGQSGPPAIFAGKVSLPTQLLGPATAG